MVHVPHDGDHRGTGLRLGIHILAQEQLVLYRLLLEQLYPVAELLDDDGGGLLVEHLVDGGHGSHVHHRLDELAGLDAHALGQLADRNRLPDRHIAHHRRGRHLEPVLGTRGTDDGADLGLLPATAALVGGDVKLGPS